MPFVIANPCLKPGMPLCANPDLDLTTLPSTETVLPKPTNPGAVILSPPPTSFWKLPAARPANLQLFAEVSPGFHSFAGLPKGVEVQGIEKVGEDEYRVSVAGPMTATGSMPTITVGIKFQQLKAEIDIEHPERPPTYHLKKIPLQFDLSFGKVSTTSYSAYASFDTQQLQDTFGVTQAEIDDITGDLIDGDFSKLFSFIQTLPALFSEYNINNDVDANVVKKTAEKFYFRFGPTIWLSLGDVYNPQKRFQLSPAANVGISVNGLVLGKDLFFGGGLKFEWTFLRINVGNTHTELIGYASTNYNHQLHTGEDRKIHGDWGAGQMLDFEAGLHVRFVIDIKTPDITDTERRMHEWSEQFLQDVKELPKELEEDPIFDGPVDIPL